MGIQMLHVIEDETSCGPLCQHPACWHSNLRKEKGFSHVHQISQKNEEIETDLPTLKIFNVFEDILDEGDVPVQPQHKSLAVSSVSNQTVSVSNVVKQEKEVKPPTLKTVQVHQMFDLKRMNRPSAAAKKHFVWVPNPNRKKHQLELYQPKNTPERHWLQQETPLHPKDLTEHMLPMDIAVESNQYQMRKPRNRSPLFVRQSSNTKLSRAKSSKAVIDPESLRELLNLPRELFEEILEQTNQCDSASKEKLHDILHKFLPPLERDLSSLSMDSTDLLQPKKISLQKSQERFRRGPQMAPAQPVFHMDDGGYRGMGSFLNTPGRGTGAFGSDFCSIRDMYINGYKDFGMKKPLPAIGDSQENGDTNMTPRLPSISLGLPELPSGIKHTKPFTYRKITDFDFTLGPMPTPPTSVCTSEGGSDHGTAIPVTIPSAQSGGEELMQTGQYLVSRSAQTPSAGTASKLPKAPVTTPATAPALDSAIRKGLHSPVVKHHEKARSQKQKSPLPDVAGQQQNTEETFHKKGKVSPARRTMKSPLCIPEVPPPPSSPQDLERENSQMEESSPHAQMSCITSETPMTHGFSSEGQVPTTTPGLPISTHTGSQPTHHRERSSVSSPEPWPAVQEDYYDVMHSPIRKSKLHDPIADSIKEEVPLSESKEPETELLKSQDVEVPGPPPPSPESREMLKTSQTEYEEDNQIINSDSATMTPLLEEKEPHQLKESIDLPTESETDGNNGILHMKETFETVEDYSKECLEQTQNMNMELGHQNKSEDISCDIKGISNKETDNFKTVAQLDDEVNTREGDDIGTGEGDDCAQEGDELPKPEGDEIDIGEDGRVGNQEDDEVQLDLKETGNDDNDEVVMEEGVIDTERAQEELREEYEKLEQ